MASLYITEFANSSNSHGRSPSMGQWPKVAGQKLSITGGVTVSAQFNANTRMIRVECDAICSINIDNVNTVTVSTSDARLFTNQAEYFGVTPDQALAVTTNV